MDRYRSYGQNDDQPKQVGDGAFIGVDEYNAPENIREANVQKAVNHDFSSQDANTRGGFVCLPELGAESFGIKWNYNAIGSSPNLGTIAFGNDRFVAGGSSGLLYVSSNGETWTLESGLPININSITFANGIFMALGYSGGVPHAAYSSDAITWTNSVTPPSDNLFVGAAYGNGKWVAVASTGKASVSTNNGVSWTTSTVAALNLSLDVAFFNGLFVASTSTGVAYSADGQTWTSVNLSAAYAPYDIGLFSRVVLHNGYYYVISAQAYIFRSSTGLSWEVVREGAITPIAQWATLATGSGYMIAVQSQLAPTAQPRALYSINGTEWIGDTTAPVYDWNDSVVGNGRLVVIGDSGNAMYSDSIVPRIFASGLYSDPFEPDTPWIVLVANDKVGFFAFGKASKTVSLGAYRVTTQSTIVQANNYLYLFRGDEETPLRWNGQWDSDFELVPDTSLPTTYGSIPKSSQATYYQNRLWVQSGKDNVAASDVLAFTDYDPVANEFSINTGNSDYVVSTFPFGTNTLVVFKNKSILALNNVEGSLLDVTTTEVTRQVGLIGINAVTSIGPDLAYVSYGNINLLTLTSTNNALQHKTLPLSARIRKIMDRVNWEVGDKISLGYWSNRLYVALPLDNSLFCNSVVVYNFITEQWFGEWAFNDDMNMCIQGWQVVGYLGLQRLHAITEDGRIFVTDEGQNDISGTTLCEISTQLVTRAYDTDGLNHIQRRMHLDVASNRPKFSVSTFTEGASEESVLITDQTYSRADSWKYADSAYDLTNANNDYNRAYRKDYSTGPNSIQPGTGFEPEMTQELRLPLISRRQGRLSWIEVTNTQGFISVMSVGYETRPGQRSNYVQV